MVGDIYENAYDQRKATKEKIGIFLVVFFLILMLFYFFVYGFQVNFYDGEQFTQQKIPMLMMSTVFTMLGFGFLLSSYKNGKLTGFTITIIVISFNYILGPLFQKICFFWVLKNKQNNVDNVDNFLSFWDQGTQANVVISPITFRLSNLCSVSFLIAMTGLVGRISIPGLLGCQILFNFFWYLNVHLNFLLSFTNNPKPLVYLDDYGLYLIYFFGAIFGLIVCLFNRSNQQDRDKKSDVTSTLYSMLGSSILFCTFSLVQFDVIILNGTMQNYRKNAGPANLWFSMLASASAMYIVSVFINRGKVGIRQATFGFIIGAITNAAGATYIENIGADLIIGFLGGSLGGIVMSLQKMRKLISDSLGHIISIIIATFIGGFIIFPCILIQHYQKGEQFGKIYNGVGGIQTQWQAAGFQLAYFAVTLCLSIFTGVFGGFVINIGKQQSTDYRDSKIFSRQYGLYQYEQNEPINPKVAAGQKEQKDLRLNQSTKQLKGRKSAL